MYWTFIRLQIYGYTYNTVYACSKSSSALRHHHHHLHHFLCWHLITLGEKRDVKVTIMNSKHHSLMLMLYNLVQNETK